VETHPDSGDVARSRADSDLLRPIPDYLQPFIVQQDPSRYTAVDHSVWRFVLLQLEARLQQTAHPSYARGLARSGISPRHIPSIQEINRALAAIGWQAVCVDGFIPPRAFQAFQALGVLPIAAEIRSPDQLPYTPAPDIIHEAAGHAPILIDPRYAAYVRASGEVATRAFSSPADARVDRAVRRLSDLKQAAPDPALDVRAAELELQHAIAALGPPSESARLARLYWWTAEYGLIGTPEDYRLYGAGLLSSLGESHFCHGSQVEKRPLTAECTLQGFDITRPQPQLFVARDFEHLHSVLSEVSRTLAYEIGGDYAAEAALRSEELCTVELPGGARAIGVLSDIRGDARGRVLCFSAGAALADGNSLLGRSERDYVLPLGSLADGSDPRRLLASSSQYRAEDGRVSWRYASGLLVSGRVCDGPWPLGRAGLWLADFRLEGPDGVALAVRDVYPLLLAERVRTAHAGSACPDVSPLGNLSESTGPRQPRACVPKPRALTPEQTWLNRLYQACADARRGAAHVGLGPAEIHAQIESQFPREWLLCWSLLDALVQTGSRELQLMQSLRDRLGQLESYYAGRHPIAMALDYSSARREAPAPSTRSAS
jgi:phenylalanine-4-hydroxylase